MHDTYFLACRVGNALDRNSHCQRAIRIQMLKTGIRQQAAIGLVTAFDPEIVAGCANGCHGES